ncbi:MAG: hypothetical protein V1802_00950 [Candidatus Aenigmatarchaeota archaeon]
MFFVSFYGCDMENTIINKCKIDISRLDDMHTKNTKIIHSDLSYCIFAGTNLGELKLQDNNEFKIIKQISEINDQDTLNALKIVGVHAESLPIEMKLHLKGTISKLANEFNKDPKLTSLQPYSKEDASYNQGNRAARIYAALNSAGEDLIKYANSELYKRKNAYGK